MSDRIFNFAPGPAILPEPVLARAQGDLLNIAGSGIGILEHSHRGPVVDRVFDETEADCRAVANIPDDYAVLFLQGGASTQFFMVPANFLAADATADYLCTGSWSKKAIAEAKHYGTAHVACSSEDADFTYVPGAEQTAYSPDPAYVHFTSNNTIVGTEWTAEPRPPRDAFLVCDASSDIFSRPIDVSRYGIIYAGAQKNLGPAGVTLVIIRRDLLERPVRELPSMLRYAIHAKNGSRYNTPPVFGIYVLGLVVRWIRDAGGLEAMAQRAEARARILYDAIDVSSFFRGTARPDCRSRMNVTFRAPSAELEASFVSEAARQGMAGLKGHRSVGGMRASLYNAFPQSGCEQLAEFMRDFESRNG
jgi:phosphoserine aminotransferase